MTPPAVKNPIIGYPGAQSYNSDPDQAFDVATNRLVQVYRVVADSFNKIMIMSTANAKEWTTPTLAFKEKNHDAVSPSLVLEADRTAKLWYVRSGADGCSSSQTTVQLRITGQPDNDNRYEHSAWTDAVPTQLTIPGYIAWHLDVQELPNNRGYPLRSSRRIKNSRAARTAISLASRRVRTAWCGVRTRFPQFSRNMKAANQLGLSTWYRGTFRYDPQTDMLDLWPSAMTKSVWGVYHASAKLAGSLRQPCSSRPRPADFHPPARSTRRSTSFRSKCSDAALIFERTRRAHAGNNPRFLRFSPGINRRLAYRLDNRRLIVCRRGQRRRGNDVSLARERDSDRDRSGC